MTKQGKEIKRMREAMRLSRRELGERLGYSAWTIQSWELGRLPVRESAYMAVEAMHKEAVR